MAFFESIIEPITDCSARMLLGGIRSKTGASLNCRFLSLLPLKNSGVSARKQTLNRAKLVEKPRIPVDRRWIQLGIIYMDLQLAFIFDEKPQIARGKSPQVIHRGCELKNLEEKSETFNHEFRVNFPKWLGPANSCQYTKP